MTEIYSMQTAGNWFCHCSLDKTQIIRKCIQLFFMHNNIFCKSSIYSCTYTNIICTKMLHSIFTEITFPTHIIRVTAHTIPHFNSIYISSDFFYNSRKLMPRNQRRCNFKRSSITIKNVHIRSTYSTILYLHQHFIVFQFPYRNIFYYQIMFSVIYCRFHIVPP